MPSTVRVSLIALLLPMVCLRAQEPSPQALQFFETKVRPVLAAQCFSCHSSKSKIAFANLRLDRREAAMRGGDSGPLVVPGDPSGGSLMRVLQYEGTPKMPPAGKLPQAQLDDISAWIKMGAPWPVDEPAAAAANSKAEDGRLKHWAWQKLRTEAIPAVRQADWPHDDIDRLVLARMEREGLQPAGDATPEILLRRVTLDLTGLPPTPEEILDFRADSSFERYTRIVDRLLASSAFGERWGRHWLDQTYFADNIELGRKVPAIHAWRYRDYVVDSFNRDVSYPRFAEEQVAGDLIETGNPSERRRNIIATGFLALGPWSLVSADKEQLRMDVVDGQVDLVGKTFLGLTMGCARCHDHKFDPIPNRDYFGMAGIFKSTQTLRGRLGLSVFSDVNRVVLPETPEEMLQRAEDTRAYEARLSAARTALRALEDERKNLVPAGSPEKKDDPAVKELDKKIAKAKDDVGLLEMLPPVPPTAHAVEDIEAPADCRINIRGNAHQLGPEVPRSFVSIAMGGLPMSEIPDWRSGRLELARWIGNRQNPLTARVAVNRIWHHLFGQGIVRTIDNFGIRGDTPSNPELLDFLAVAFMENGWSHKQMIRRIVLTRAYRLSGDPLPANLEKDPENRLTWRMSRRRLEAETIRDSILAITGKLDRTAGGPSLPLWVPGNMSLGKPESLKDNASLDPATQYRRTVYLPVLRKSQLPDLDLLNLFNFPDVNQVTGARPSTTIPTQALYLLNAPFLREQAAILAASLLASPGDDAARVKRLVLLVYNRPSSPAEVDSLLTFVQSYEQRLPPESTTRRQDAWMRLCHSLFASNEFLYRS